MKRLAAMLLDRGVVAALRDRVVMTFIAICCGFLGALLLLAAGFIIAARDVGTVPTLLGFSAGFLLLGWLISFASSYHWRHRPRPLANAGRLAVVAELFVLARRLISKEPAKLILAAFILGAITEQLDRTEKE